MTASNGRTASLRKIAAPGKAAAPSHHHRPGIVLAVIVGCQLMIGLDTSVVTIALPEVGQGLGLSTGGLAWIQYSYMLAFGGLLLLGGRAGDVFGRRRTFTAGVVLFTAASLLGGLATAGWALLAARTAQGFAAAVAAPSAMALIATAFEGRARVRALSVLSAVTGAGAAVGMIVGGVLTEAGSWRWVFFVNLPVGLALALVAPRVLAETERRPGRFDVGGAVASTLGMTVLVYALIRVGETGWDDSRALAAFGAAAVLLAGFAAVETRAGQPIMPLWLLTGRDRAASYLVQLCLTAAMFGSFFFLTQYLQQILGYGPLRAGAAFLPMVGMQFAVVRTAPRLMRRLGARPLVIAGTALVAAGLLWLSRLSPGDGYAGALLVPFMLMGAGGGMSIMPLNATILASVRPEQSGAASGVAQTMLWSGGSLGSAVMVTVHGSAASGHPVDGMGAAFATGAVFAAAALLVAVLVLRVRR
ncbi:drug resistance transporter, EmrB/QacA subfamily [Actinomadura madurae]|uniref:Drug resistance transporter, EmrB/QacA subfamily n=1 Tax=Actinomadura madurae TaxID=1993 RepID=A0A1I5AG29_9ACTN|nr:MFS transporter [Actinomadura madurae]SFN61456.1 drug resistance transporter, EmrB/QacA subfamily [Actinomadura madurae]